MISNVLMDWHSEKLHYINSYVFPLPHTLNAFHLQCLKFCPRLSLTIRVDQSHSKDTHGQKQNKKPRMVCDIQQSFVTQFFLLYSTLVV